MVSAVVLDDELEFGIAKIESLRPVAIQFTKDVVDLGFGQSTQHNEHPQPRLPRRIDSRSHVRGRSAAQSSALTQVAIGATTSSPGVVPLRRTSESPRATRSTRSSRDAATSKKTRVGSENEQSSVNAGILVARDAMGHNATPFRSR